VPRRMRVRSARRAQSKQGDGRYGSYLSAIPKHSLGRSSGMDVSFAKAAREGVSSQLDTLSKRARELRDNHQDIPI
jgi:hypothetical protein